MGNCAATFNREACSSMARDSLSMSPLTSRCSPLSFSRMAIEEQPSFNRPPTDRQALTNNTAPLMRGFFILERHMDASTLALSLLLASLVIAIPATVLHNRRQRRRELEEREALLQRERDRIAVRLSREQAGAAISPAPSWRDDRRSAARTSAAPSPSPAPDYLTQHMLYQSMASPAPAPSYEPPCRASSYASGGGGDFGGGGASSSWDSGSSSDSSSSSSSDSSSSSSCD